MRHGSHQADHWSDGLYRQARWRGFAGKIHGCRADRTLRGRSASDGDPATLQGQVCKERLLSSNSEEVASARQAKPAQRLWAEASTWPESRVNASEHSPPKSDLALLNRLDALPDEGAHLLIVDDDPELLRFLVQELADAGYQASGCDNGQDALLRLRQEQFQLVLLDWTLPDFSGIEVCRRLGSGNTHPC